MKNSVVKTILAAVALTGLVSTGAQAATITFDNTAADGGFSSIARGSSYVEGNYTVDFGNTGTYFFIDNDFGLDAPVLSTFDDDVLEFNGANSAAVITRNSDDQLFNVRSLTTAGWGNSPTSSVEFTGFLDGIAQATLIVDLVRGDVLDLVFDQFTGIDSFKIFSADGTYPIFDDINLGVGNVSAVPVPAALPLLATGLAGIGLMGWRKRKTA